MHNRFDGRIALVLLLGAHGCSAEVAPDRMTVRALAETAILDGTALEFVPIGWIAVGPDGIVAVAQRQDGTVRLFDRNGAELQRVGRQGEGPGEFRELSTGGWCGDSLWIMDAVLRRLSVASVAGGVVRSIAVPDPAELMLPPPEPRPSFVSTIGWCPPDRALLHLPLDPVPAPGSSARIVHTVGNVATVIARLPEDGSRKPVVAEGFSPGSTLRVPFFPSPHWQVSPDGRAVVIVTTSFSAPTAGDLDITLIGADGDTLLQRRTTFTTSPIPESVRDSALAQLLPLAFPGRDALLDQLDVPQVYPPLVEVVLGADSAVWLGLRPDAGGRPWLRVTPSGELSRLHLPLTDRLRAATEGELWAIRRGMDDVESVVRFRIE